MVSFIGDVSRIRLSDVSFLIVPLIALVLSSSVYTNLCVRLSVSFSETRFTSKRNTVYVVP